MITLIACGVSFLVGCFFGFLITAVLVSSNNWNDEDDKKS